MTVTNDMRCAHCGRVLAGVAVLFPGTPAVCGRADCLAWARALAVASAPSASSEHADVAEAPAAA